MSKSELPGPLQGYRILDLTTMVSGPLCTMILADQGADVIKVERPGGEYMRQSGNKLHGVSSTFISCNRNKRALAVDAKQPAGLEILRQLAATSDVLVQNFRPGAIDRIGLGEAAVRKLKEDIIYVSISGFGEHGPYSGQRVYDPIIQALSGLADVQRDRETGQPRMVRTIIPDKTTSLTTAQAITAALLHRERTGAGQHVRVAMLDAMVALLWPESISGLNFVGNEVDPARAQMGLDLVFATQDGHITAATVGDAEWRGFCTAIERPDMIEDPRFFNAAERAANQSDRRAFMSGEIARWKNDDILPRLLHNDVPCAPILDRRELLDNPQVLQNALIEVHEDPVLGPVRQPRAAAQFDRSPAQIRSLAPQIGADNEQILAELGYSPTEIQALRDDAIIAHD